MCNRAKRFHLISCYVLFSCYVLLNYSNTVLFLSVSNIVIENFGGGILDRTTRIKILS